MKTVTDENLFFDKDLPDAVEPDPGVPGKSERQALDDVFSLAYEELRRLARSVRRNDARASMTPTTIVNEAWMKLARTPGVASTSPLHFKRIAARAMRQVLVDAARLRQTRGGRMEHIVFDESLGLGMDATLAPDRQMLALDQAITELGKIAPRQAALVEARFFGGLETAEVGELLGISDATALRDWRAAKAWLALEVRRTLA